MDTFKVIKEKNFIYSLSFLKDKRLVSASEKGIIIYDKNNYESETIIHENSRVISICVLANGNLAYAISYFFDIKILRIDGNSYENIHTLSGHKSYINKIVELNDGKICTCSDDLTIRIFDNYQNIKILKVDNDVVKDIIEMNNYIISFDSSPIIWNKLTYVCIKHLKYEPSGNVMSKLDNNRIIIGGDYKLVLFNILSFEYQTIQLNSISSIRNICVLKNGRVLLANEKGFISFFDLSFGQILFTCRLHTNRLSCIIENEDNQVFSSSNCNIVCAKIFQLQLITELKLNYNKGCFCFLRDGRLALGYENDILIYNNIGYELNIIIIDAHADKENIKYKVVSLCGLKNGNLLSTGEDNLIKIWEINQNNYYYIYALVGHIRVVEKVIELEDGILCSHDRGCSIKIWDNYECIKTLNEYEKTLDIMEIDKYIISLGDYDNSKRVTIWNKRTFKLIKAEDYKYLYTFSKLKDNKLILGGEEKLTIVDMLSFNKTSIYMKELQCPDNICEFRDDILLIGNNYGDILCINLLGQILFTQKMAERHKSFIIKTEGNKILIFLSNHIKIYEWIV